MDRRNFGDLTHRFDQVDQIATLNQKLIHQNSRFTVYKFPDLALSFFYCTGSYTIQS